jgi:thioredoxin
MIGETPGRNLRPVRSPALQPTAASFERDVFESDLPVLVDFWAPWCAPCRMLKPVVCRVGEQMEGRARIAFVNVDEQPELAEQFGVQSIPALMIVKDGEVIDAFTGYVPEETLRERVEAMIEE